MTHRERHSKLDLVTFNGKVYSIHSLCKSFNIAVSTYRSRIKRGWEQKDALERPPATKYLQENRKIKTNPLWWLSFADYNKFNGVVLVRGKDFLSALEECIKYNLNPGGQVAGWEIDKLEPPIEMTYKLLNIDEAILLGGAKLGDLEKEK